jgi:hypothetical protein
MMPSRQLRSVHDARKPKMATGSSCQKLSFLKVGFREANAAFQQEEQCFAVIQEPFDTARHKRVF